ncbi:hypothetical protein [Niabella drilacis]|uniref:Uncharacterized protein n=1 Tax=Niabella drilacis (strain DSM 25811 / CCM 8410 / CCUG 62505 / LMG 26954 / E90) TaxID=1285928 RepID=A0A1G7B116_NIADE|nr:hypothetical protein [Niabella drilacis]SDE19935.1 hypothetical protein SAMN04487894_1263 [Niabella drilacis]
MSLIKAIKRLEYANYLIKRKASGDLETFARKMNLYRNATKGILSQMRELGATIIYDRQRKTYCYTEDGEFCISRFMKYGDLLTREDACEIGKPEEVCFSEKAIFVLCREI